jgi:hypothetical protein
VSTTTRPRSSRWSETGSAPGQLWRPYTAEGAAILVGGARGDCGIGWLGADPGDPALPSLIRHAISFEIDPGIPASTVVAEHVGHDLAALGYRRI